MTIKVLYANGRGEFILIKPKKFYEKRDITIKYVVSYIHKKNNLNKCRWKTIMIIKDFFFIDSNLSLEFQTKSMDIANYLQNYLLIKVQK